MLSFDYTNNEQSRPFQFYIPETFVAFFNLSIPHAYILQRFGFVFLAFCGFHVYLQKWFDNKGVVLGVVLLATVMPLTYLPHLQESAPLLMLSFLLGLWAIRENRQWHFMAVLFLGALWVYAFFNFSAKPLFLRRAALMIPNLYRDSPADRNHCRDAANDSACLFDYTNGYILSYPSPATRS